MVAAKWVLVSLLLISPIFAGGQNAPSSTKRAGAEQEISRLHDEWLKAYDGGDAETLDRIEGDDFTVAGEFGQRSKQQQLDNVRHRSQKSSAVTRTVENRQFSVLWRCRPGYGNRPRS